MAYLLKLYIMGETLESREAIDNLRKILSTDVEIEYKLDVIDLKKNPKLAEDEKILATPMLEKKLPPPVSRIIGDLSDKHKILLGLDIVAYAQEVGFKNNERRFNILEKLPSGIRGFDEISQGGVPKGRTTLVSGTSGSGKTVFAATFLYNGIEKFDENGVFVTFEEKPNDIIRNMTSFGWRLNAFIDAKKWRFVDVSPENIASIEAGKYNLDALLLRIENAVYEIDAVRVSIDSISALFTRYDNISLIRKELYRVCDKLKQLGVTTIMTAERPTEEGEIARFGIEEFATDNVILLHNRLTRRGFRERTIEILKFRGSSHETSEAPLIVTKNAIEVFPRPKPDLRGRGFMEKIKTGIPGLDDILFGGVHKNSTTLISGASGTGKTVSALHFILEGALNNEKCMFIEFEESPEQIYRNAESFGWDFETHVKKGNIRLICHYPEELKAEQYQQLIQDWVIETGAKRVVLDSLSALERIYEPEKFREFVIGLNAFLKMNDCTSVLTNTTNELLGLSQITETHLSTTTDNIIILKYVELSGMMKKLITVLKARGSSHIKEFAEFEITDKGLQILGFYKGIEGLLSGSARVASVPARGVTEQMIEIDIMRRRFLDKEISEQEYSEFMENFRREINNLQKTGF